jgi:hypothetical protein
MSAVVPTRQRKKLQTSYQRPLSLDNRELFIQNLEHYRRLTPTAVSFTRFSELPPELRIRIWGFHLSEPRIVDVYYSERTQKSGEEQYDIEGYAHWATPLPPPSALSVCTESRTEALKVYGLYFARQEIKFQWPTRQYRWTIVPPLLPRIFFNKQDTLYVHEFTKPYWSTSIADRLSKDDVSMVVSLAVNIEDWWTASTGYLKVRRHIGNKLQKFCSLKFLTLVLIRQDEDEMQKLCMNHEIQLIDIKKSIGKGTKVEKPWNLGKIRAAVEKEIEETETRFPAWERPQIRYAQMVGRFIE